MTEIEKLRKRLGLDPEQMAGELGISRGYYYRLANGTRPISVKLAMVINKRWPNVRLSKLLKDGRVEA